MRLRALRATLLTAAICLASACSIGADSRELADDGISFRYPHGWHVAGFSTTNSPRRLAVASYPLPEDVVEGDCGGLEAVRLLPNDGAAVILVDYGPGRFSDGPLDLREGAFAEYECFGPSTMYRFRVGDRNFQAHVALGPEAGETMRDRAIAILQSLTVEEPARFVPPTHEDGDRVVVPIAFPDGTTAELRSPLSLGLEGFSIQPYSSAVLPRCGGSGLRHRDHR
ncbi:MAG TPA: hypothetical protein VMN35_03655 [Gaiellaceae bacterium]|nr:hypothetical protein [Gaiellaceae bacterium]